MQNPHVEPKFKQWVYQVVVEGSTIVVLNSHSEALNFISKEYSGADCVIVPVAVFTYP